MRIDFVTDTYPPDVNGVAMTLANLTAELRKRNHLVHICHTGETRRGETSHLSLSLPGYNEVRVGLPSPLKLRKRWKHKRPDVIYVATESPMGASAIKAARQLGIPVATGFHTNFHDYLDKSKVPHMQDIAMAYLKRTHNKADCTIAPSPDTVAMLEDSGFKNVKLMGRGINHERFHPNKRCKLLRSYWQAEANEPVALIVGRLASEKNLPLAMQTIRELQVDFPSLKAVCVGDGPEKEKLQLAFPEVKFVGTQRDDELAAHYASADLFIFPSETETFGNVLIEAMSCELTCVAYDYAAAALYLKDGENGFTANKGDQAEFKNKCRLALEHVSRQDRSLGMAARKSISHLSWPQVAKKFESHLREIRSSYPAKKQRIKNRLNVRTLILSDLHLGTPDAKARQVVDLLKNTDCERIILNGDIIDGWEIKRGAKWLNTHTRVIRTLLKKIEKDKVEVIYLRGNHDDILERFLPLNMGRLKLAMDYHFQTADGRNYYIIHGDGFDSVSTNHKWVAVLGSLGYNLLLKINRFYNKYRAMRGKEYYSISKKIKAKVKSAVNFISSYEEKLEELAVSKNCEGIICGHIHTPADKMINHTHYLNSGDWVESLTCIIEDHHGAMEVITYQDFLKRTQLTPAPADELEEFEVPFPNINEIQEQLVRESA